MYDGAADPAVRRVTINGRFLTQPVTGVQRVARETVRALDELLDDPAARRRWTMRIVAPSNAEGFPELHHVPVLRTTVGRGQLWEQVVLPLYAADSLLVSLANTAPLAAGAQVVFVHDAGVWAIPDAYSPAFRRYYQALLPRVARRARRVATNSEFSAGELALHARIPRELLRVVPLGADHATRAEADPAMLDRLALPMPEFVLAVGAAGRHKNLEVLAAAFADTGLAGLTLVVVGEVGHRAFEGAARTSGARVHYAGRVSDGELRALYDHALCLAYPSSYEGFGLPPLEAMACGCPVLAANAGALPETCGDGARYLPPGDARAWASEIALLRETPALREAMADAGRKRALAFRWERTARTLLDVLAEAG